MVILGPFLVQISDIKPPIDFLIFFHSFQKDILVAHLCWEYCHRWDKDKSRLQLLQVNYMPLFNIFSDKELGNTKFKIFLIYRILMTA